ncbi:ArdC-like ssDNA-binding domain-containing protein [Sinorhizobium meliloti]|uniref:ArdC-like ssDNA-binding domain-containing protein n=1 Tax=Rhizobium meliloti TaxID=382 RepID=UPI003B51C537
MGAAVERGQAYTGLNVLLLWSESVASGFMSSTWMTLRQANELGAHVRKGESGATVVYASRFTKTEPDAGGGEVERDIPFLKAYTRAMPQNIPDFIKRGSIAKHVGGKAVAE